MGHKSVSTEYTSGHLIGTTTPKIRVLMRSEDAFIYVSYGVFIAYRKNPSYSTSIKLAKTATRQELSTAEAKGKIDEFFGPEASQVVMQAFNVRGKGTVLYNGGGEPLPLPIKEEYEKLHNEWAKVTPTKILFNDYEKCMECGENLSPKFEVHDLGHESCVSIVDECQRLTNHRIIEIQGHKASEPRQKWPFIRSFKIWREGEYWDEFFCSNQCAARYGRKAARLEKIRK